MERNQVAMRIVILIQLVCFISTITTAQKISPDPINKDKLYLFRDKAANMRTTGMIMTLAGLPVYVTGVFLLINYALETPVEERGGFEPKLYTSMTIGGAISSVVGVALWKNGSRKMKAEIALKAYNIKTDNPMAVGLGISLRF
jgi:hypothetical protein